MEIFEEFDTKSSKHIKADIVKKNIAGLIDAFIVIIINNSYFYFIPKNNIEIINFSNVISFIAFYIFLTFIIYRIITIFTFGNTLGMLISKIQFAKENKSKINPIEKLLSIFMIYINGLDCYNKQ
jgi:Ca2+/Na+ antiporter